MRTATETNEHVNTWLQAKASRDRVRRAAPDLLEACKCLLQQIDGPSYSRNVAIAKAQEAIAKAEYNREGGAS